jgi:glycosyltransferase involved in cell wall biosynthesis
MRPIKVAWDNYLASQDKAGTGTYAARLLGQFRNRADLELNVLTGWRPGSRSRSFAGRAVATLRNIVWTQVSVPTKILKKRVDLLHAPAFLAPVVSPSPVVITIHDVTYILYPSHFARWWTAYLGIVMPVAVRSAAAIICGSENSKADIGRTYAVPLSKVHVIPYGVDHDRFHPGITLDQRWAQTLGLREGYLLHVGTFSYRKNIPTVLRAISYLRAKGKWGTRQLVLAGSQSEGMKGVQEVYDTIRELDLGSSVVLTGYVPDEHVPGLYAHASALVMPSLYEGFGFPVLESMAVGTPVIASNSSSLPEVAEDAAILVPPQDVEAWAKAIEDVIESPTISSELQRKGLARARQFSWERTAEQTVAVYRSVASG